MSKKAPAKIKANKPAKKKKTTVKSAPPKQLELALPGKATPYTPKLVEIKGPIEGCSGPAWTRLLALSDGRKRSIAKEAELVRTRKALEEQIAQEMTKAMVAGKGQAPATEANLKNLKADHFDVEAELDYERARTRWFADTINDVIDKARQGKLYHEDEPTEPDQQMLFPPPAAPKKDGRTGKAEEAHVPEGVNQHLAAAVIELGMEDAHPTLHNRTVKAGFKTVADVKKACDEKSDEELEKVLGLGHNYVAALRMRLKEYLKRHTKADLDQERALANA